MVITKEAIMNIRIAFRNMEHSVAIENYVNKELEKVTKFLQKEDGDTINIDVVLDAKRTHHHHHVEIRLSSKHYHLIASHEGPDLYLEIDHVVKTMVSEVKKQKERNLDKRNHPDTKKNQFDENFKVDDEDDDQA